MAFITSEQSKAIREEIKKQFPKYKFSVSIKDYAKIFISLMQADFEVDFDKNEYTRGTRHMNINYYYLDKEQKEICDIFTKVKQIMFKIAKYHNNSDIQTDYFDVAYYYSFSIGKWDKGYICKK